MEICLLLQVFKVAFELSTVFHDLKLVRKPLSKNNPNRSHLLEVQMQTQGRIIKKSIDKARHIILSHKDLDCYSKEQLH